MSNDVLVSVIIPAFNAAKYIEETINSVLKQTHSNLELIIVDDGSTDSTYKLIEAIGKNDARIKLIKQTNAGVSIARNKGYSASKGSYIAYLDADDLWVQNFIELALVKFSSDESLGLVHCDNQIIDCYSKRMAEVNIGEEGYILDNLLLGGGGKYIFAISGVLIKRDAIEKVQGFDVELSNGADHYFYLKMAKHFKIGRIPIVALYYRIHSDNMHSNIDLLEKDTLAFYKKADKYKLFKTPAFRRECYSNIYLILAGSWWVDGKNKMRGIQFILKAAITYPPIIIKLLNKLR